MRRLLISFVALSCLVISAKAERSKIISPIGSVVNIDLGTGMGVPATDFVGAGPSGFWNGIESLSGEPRELLDAGGSQTGVTLMITPANAGLQPSVVDHRQTDGEVQALVDDGLMGLGDIAVTYTFDGLIPGVYNVVTYSVDPAAAQFGGTTVSIEDIFQTASGEWPGFLQYGLNYTHHTVSTEDGTMDITTFGSFGGSNGMVNGFQIWGQASSLVTFIDLTSDGTVDATDLAEFLGLWSDGHGCNGFVPATTCPGDFNFDSVINAADLAILLGHWTGSSPTSES